MKVNIRVSSLSHKWFFLIFISNISDIHKFFSKKSIYTQVAVYAIFLI